MEKFYKEEQTTIYKFDVDFGFKDLRFETECYSKIEAQIINNNLNFTIPVLRLLHSKIFRDDWGMEGIHRIELDNTGNIKEISLITTNPCGQTSDTSEIHHYDYPFLPTTKSYIRGRIKTYLDQLYEVYIKVPDYSLERTDFKELNRDLCKHIGEVRSIYEHFGYEFETRKNQNRYILRRKNNPNNH